MRGSSKRRVKNSLSFTTQLETMKTFIKFNLVLRFVPESSRYLLLKGKLAETEEILREIAATNKKKYPEEPLDNPCADGKVQQIGDFRDLFRTKKMVHRTLVSWYAW